MTLTRLAVAALVALAVGPMAAMIALVLLTGAATNQTCATQSMDVPKSLTATTTTGETVTLDHQQLLRAAAIVKVALATPGAGRRAARIALMAAITESSLRLLSNRSAYPESAGYPNDGDGSDHDSLGLFQMRPSTGWGTVAQVMNAEYDARAFFGGPNGPNHGSPAGLLDVVDWQSLSDGEAAQAVEVSAFPTRYSEYAPVALSIESAVAPQNTAQDARC